MIFARQKEALALLEALGGDIGALDFQKLLFLYSQELGESAPYDFVPYKYGAFSFTSYADKRKLIEKKVLEADDSRWTLTAAGWKILKASPFRDTTADFVNRLGKLRGEELVAEAYRRFPYYATRSEIAESVLRRDHEALAAVHAEKLRPARPGLYTIGYEGLSLESYLNRLIQAGVGLLCDVRRNPLSRKYGFSRSTLSQKAESVGIRYEHLPELGISSHERSDLDGPADYERLFATYRSRDLPLQGVALGRIRRWVEEGLAVALTCFEASATMCHRGCVASYLEAHSQPALASRHL